MSRTFMLHNKKAKSLFTNWWKNCPINNQVTYLFFHKKKIINFSEPIWIFNFFHVFENLIFVKNNYGLNHEIVRSITRKILKYNMKSW